MKKKGLATQTEQLISLKASQELQRLALSDQLTQVANRRRLETYLEQQWQQMGQEHAPLSLIVGNFDFFKAYNNTQGHQAGDKCLQHVAKAIIAAVQRPADLVPRYGGEEFFVILPNTTAEEAVEVAAEICYQVKVLEIDHPNSQISKYLSLSLGVATIIPTDEYSSAMLISAADQAVYQAKAQGRDRIILHETLLHQTKVVQQEKLAALPQSKEFNPLAVSEGKNGTAPMTELLMSFVAYYVSRGKTVISPVSGSLPFGKSVYECWGYQQDFQDFWKQLALRRDFRELYIQGDFYSFGQLLDGSCTVSECARCNLPTPRFEGHAYDLLNCTLCDEPCLSVREFNSTESQGFEDKANMTRVVAVGATPTDAENLKEWFSLNGFELTFVREPEAVTPECLPPSVDLVIIHGSSSEAQGEAWAQALRPYPQFQGVPIIVLSAEAGWGLPWTKRTLGIEDYVIVPHSGDRLADHLRHVRTPQLNTGTTQLHWFPG